MNMAVPYWEWEDHTTDLYDVICRPTKVARSLELLLAPDALFDEMIRVIELWPKATEAHLGYLEINSNAWLGWSSCYLAHAANYTETRAAWGQMDPWEHDMANDAADHTKDIWERRTNGQQDLFGH